MEEKSIREHFGIRNSTLNFILLNAATLGMFYFIWMWKFTNKVSNEVDINSNRVLAILALSFAGWATFFNSVRGMVIIGIEESGFMYIILSITYGIFILILSFRTKKNLEQYLLDINHKIPLNGFLCFIFPFLYQYYIVYNAKEISQKMEKFQNTSSPTKDISEELINLNKLKEDGTLTEEQFEQAKNKLLS